MTLSFMNAFHQGSTSDTVPWFRNTMNVTCDLFAVDGSELNALTDYINAARVRYHFLLVLEECQAGVWA